jgi:hypothetical protein
MTGRLSISVLRVVLGVVLAGYSALLVAQQLHGPAHLPLVLLGLTELIAAIVFLLPRMVRLGGIGLIVVFVLAASFHIAHGEYDVAYLGIYGAAVLAGVINER